MNNTPENIESQLNHFARDIIMGHATRVQMPYPKEVEGLLIRILPIQVKASPVALRKAVETVSYSTFNRALARQELNALSFDQFSLNIVENYFSHMYAYQDRTIMTFSVAEWATDRRSRLTKRQIEMWEKDDNPRTQRLSNLQAKGARDCIKEGIIKIDDQFKQGVYTLYKLDSGIFNLLKPGIKQLKTYKGTLDEQSAKSFATEEIHLDNVFVNVPYQTI